jgi:cullin 2
MNWYTGELKLNYLKKNYMITMQTYQMAILLLFEKSSKQSFADLQETLQLGGDHLSKHITSLMECKLLICDSEVVLFLSCH